MIRVRQLQHGDEDVLTRLAREAVEFGMSDDGHPLVALDAQAARAYLDDPSSLHWVAFDGDVAVGTMVAVRLMLPVSPGEELLLHEIGVRESCRRQGVGRALLGALDEWMRANRISTVWLLADGEGAESFYQACGFQTQPDQPTYMLRSTTTERGAGTSS